MSLQVYFSVSLCHNRVKLLSVDKKSSNYEFKINIEIILHGWLTVQRMSYTESYNSVVSMFHGVLVDVRH